MNMSDEQKKEGIRAWYQRTTRRSMRGLTWATIACLVGMSIMWATSSIGTLQHLQTFNGALSVPLLGGIWIFFFIFGFLIPSREASFRAQEALEEGVSMLQDAIQKQAQPVLAIWKRIGEKVEKEIDGGMIAELKDTALDLRKSIAELRDGNKDIKPVIEKLKKIQDRLDDNFLMDLHEGAKAIRMMGQPLPPPAASGKGSKIEEEPVDAPQVGKALSMIRKKADKNGGVL